MVQRFGGVALVALGLVTGCTVSLPVGGEVPNGKEAQLSFDVDGAVAAGSPFKVKVWAPTVTDRCYGMLGCSSRAPMMSAILGCTDEAQCVQTDKEPNETEDNECTFIMMAGQPGTTEIIAEVTTADGEVRRDRITVNVVAATDVLVDCPRCNDGSLEPGEEAELSCHPMNLAVQDFPLRGDCEVLTGGAGVVTRPAGVDAEFNITTDRGVAANNFMLRLEDREGGDVTFRSGSVERTMHAQAGMR
ncbi:MAG: hypothetical protein AB2A00_41225 [Myxococcota bacterium]